jgi:hypothetical protein
MDQHQPDSQTGQQGKIVYQSRKTMIGYGFATKINDEGFAAVGIDIGRRPPETADETGGGRRLHFCVR